MSTQMIEQQEGRKSHLPSSFHPKHNSHAISHTQQITDNNQTMSHTIAEYFKTQPVEKAWIFGSFARGEETPMSDVDIIVLLDHSKPIGMKFFNMWNDLERMLNRKVDLVEEGELLPFAIESANRDKQLIYERTC